MLFRSVSQSRYHSMFPSHDTIPCFPVTIMVGRVYSMSIHGYDTIEEIYNYMYKDAGTFFLERKKEKFEEIFDLLKLLGKHTLKHGVFFDKNAKKWKASSYENKKRTVKSFDTFQEAKEYRVNYEFSFIKGPIE